MAGILDFLTVGGSNAGGILSGATPGAMPDWANKLGLFGATMGDVGANLSGHPADATNLASWSKTAKVQQLLGGLNSTDPDARAQAYQTALALGVDPAPWQKAQAAKAEPALLNSMANGQSLAVPKTSVPLSDGSTLDGGGFTMQTAPLSVKDALQYAPPELQQQYLPKLVDTQMTADSKAAEPFTLGPGQHHFVNGKDVGSVPALPRTAGGMQSMDGGNTWQPIPGYVNQQSAITGARRDAIVSRPMPGKAKAGSTLSIPHPASQY